jgi:hypothetical protein
MLARTVSSMMFTLCSSFICDTFVRPQYTTHCTLDASSNKLKWYAAPLDTTTASAAHGRTQCDYIDTALAERAIKNSWVISYHQL